MNPYELFGTSEQLENNGIEINYGSFSISIARAGGHNRAFQNRLAELTRQHKRAIANGRLGEEEARKIMLQAFASVVVGWEGVTDREGNPMPFNQQNVIKLLADLPDLFEDLKEQATDASLFRQEQLEQEAKN